MEYFRFPHTPHLAWLGSGTPRDDKVLAPEDARELLAHEVTVEEKVDGANLGLSTDESGALRAQNRGAFISAEHGAPQFKSLFRWLEPRREAIAAALYPDLMLFGEWCYAVHSVRYTRLPDWFLAFDVYDRARREFWSVLRRNALVSELNLSLVPLIGAGRFDLLGLRALLGDSRITDGPAEGLYVRRDEGRRLVARAKLVKPDFVQSIGDHWSRRSLEQNRLLPAAANRAALG
jgi:RNA ligase